MNMPGFTAESSLYKSKAICARAFRYLAHGIIAAALVSPVMVLAGSDSPVEFSCQGERDGNYKNPNACESYIACSNGRKYIMLCPTGLYWDWNSKEAPANCDDEYDGQCLGQCTSPAEASCKAISQ